MNWRGAILPLSLIAGAQLAAATYGITSDALASPAEILGALLAALADGSMIRATLETLAAALGGLFVGGAAGILAGILLGLSGTLNRLMSVSIELVRPVPSVAIIPLFMLVFGLGFRLEIAVVAFSVVWTVLVLTRGAVAGIEPRLLEVARVLGLSRAQAIWKIVLPSALPRIFVALRLAATVSLIVAVTVEVAVNPLGLGYGMQIAQQALRPAWMFAYLVWLIVVGWTFNHLLVRLETVVLRRLNFSGPRR
ncbi:ABC transporter permease [Aquibium microcysteis]|uniref:ABC transporter permease n=1 Tax=Aquibium microcysteis TaxID=675281 RepID=UPI00165D1AE0|nr:ABC transporter permease subunit [Aquibium microcysteis]